MNKTRWSFYFVLAMAGVVCAEGMSWSTPVIFPVEPFVFVFYGLHYLLIVDYLAARNAITLRGLIAGGVVLGIVSESIFTKVIWEPPYTEETIYLLGVGVYEVFFVVMVWHAWMSVALPLGLVFTQFDVAAVFTAKQARRVLWGLPFVMVFTASVVLVVDPAALLVAMVLNGSGILLAVALYRRFSRRYPLRSIGDLRLRRGERRWVWGAVMVFYLLGLFGVRPEAWPADGPLLVGLLLIAAAFWLLRTVRRADTNRTRPPLDLDFRYRAAGRYFVYFVAVTFAASLVPVLAVGLLLIFVAVLVGNAWIVRQALQARRVQSVVVV